MYPDDSTAYQCPPTEYSREIGMSIEVETVAVPVKFELDHTDPAKSEAWYVSKSTLGSLVPLEGGSSDETCESETDAGEESDGCTPYVNVFNETWTHKVDFISGVAPFALYVLAPRARASGLPVDTDETADGQ